VHGAKRGAPVLFASVMGEVQRWVGADRPFDVFIGFLTQAWPDYGALYDPRYCPRKHTPTTRQAIEVIAYDNQGEPIARETGNNITSVGGRPLARDSRKPRVGPDGPVLRRSPGRRWTRAVTGI
jgi:hypothetical protein